VLSLSFKIDYVYKEKELGERVFMDMAVGLSSKLLNTGMIPFYLHPNRNKCTPKRNFFIINFILVFSKCFTEFPGAQWPQDNQ